MRRTRKTINQINVVPYIDVMLVLLVIFMVTAPLISPGEIELPSVGSKLTTPVLPLEVTLRNDLSLWLRDQAANTPAARVTREELIARVLAKQTKQEDLKRQVSRWQDPNYVKQQARDRINMVMPGETGYWVFGSDLPAAQSSGTAGAASAQDPANLPWVDALWESIRRSATD